MILKRIIGVLKIIIGSVFLLGSIVTLSKVSFNDASDIVGSAIAVFMILGYGFSTTTNGLADLKGDIYRKIFLRLEIICGFCFILFFIVAAILDRDNTLLCLSFISIGMVILILSIRNISIIKKGINIAQ